MNNAGETVPKTAEEEAVLTAEVQVAIPKRRAAIPGTAVRLLSCRVRMVVRFRSVSLG